MSMLLAAAVSTAPNVLVLLTDDQGWGDLEYNCVNDTEYCPRKKPVVVVNRPRV